ncbi:MAG: LLM class flavin-dependent oxidoreductase, partial [Janthinobacterium lividum]
MTGGGASGTPPTSPAGPRSTGGAARTTTFKPLIAVRPGYRQPAQFASATATRDQPSRGRVPVNIVSGLDDVAAHGDLSTDLTQRYARTNEFLQVVRQRGTEDDVAF